nr:hypothetical protein [Tanacetum cinerariifolium]
MHKAFPLPVMEFPLPEEVPTASEESWHCQKKRDSTTVKIRTATKVKKIETTDEGTKIFATVDGKPKTISESSIMRNLKLRDEA